MVGHVYIHPDTYAKGIAQITKDRSRTIFNTMWACHLYLVAVGMLPAVQGVAYKKLYIACSLVFFAYIN